MQGGAWSIAFPLFVVQPYQPFSIAGYGARFALGANYGDGTELITCSIGSPSARGSSISLVTIPGAQGVVCAAQPNIRGADTLALSIMPGQRTARFFGQVDVTPPGGDPLTVWAGTWYVWARI